jgi:signal transduction histidine kinase
MFAPPMPPDEGRRLEALHRLQLLDTAPEPRFDRITRLACSVAKAPIAIICLVDLNRQWFKSRQGLDVIETARETSFCAHAILQSSPLIVADTHADERFIDNPVVIGAPYARFYAGHPIHAPEGSRVGTLCVLDTQPRDLLPQQVTALADLAAMVDAELSAIRFDVATRTVGVGVHERHADDREMWWSDAMWDILGQDRSSFRASADNWLAAVHPDDREYVKEHGGAWGKSRTTASLQYRIVRPDGSIRHLQSFAAPTVRHSGARGMIAGITLDVTERVVAEQRQSGEQQKLRDSSHLAGMSAVATDVLHSVGNVVNSLGIAHSMLRRHLKAMRLGQLEQAAAMLHANRENLAAFLAADERGRHLPAYLPALSTQIASQARSLEEELDSTDALLEHLRNVLSAQQVRAHLGGVCEATDLAELLDAVLAGQVPERLRIQAVRQYERLPRVMTDRHKLRMILVNLVDNARDAVLSSDVQSRKIVLSLRQEEKHAVITIEDSGVGIPSEVLPSLWRFGFTTKPNGQGFDLHNSANAARDIGATIDAQSDGANKGSRYTVRLPIVTEHDGSGTATPVDDGWTSQ